MSFFQRGPENGNLTHMRFFVAGATGYTGRSLVVLAASRGVTVTAHIRPDSANVGACKAAFEADGVTVCVAQWSPDLMGDAVALARPTHVYGLLGTTAAKARAAARGGHAPAGYQNVDVALTRMLMDATAAHAPEARFIYLSSLGAGGSMRNAYLNARHQVEEALRAASLRFTVVRPSFISGADRPEVRVEERIGATFMDAAMGLLGTLGARDLANRYRPITGPGLARALLAVAERDDTDGRVVEAEELHRLARAD